MVNLSKENSPANSPLHEPIMPQMNNDPDLGLPKFLRGGGGHKHSSSYAVNTPFVPAQFSRNTKRQANATIGYSEASPIAMSQHFFSPLRGDSSVGTLQAANATLGS